MRRIGTIAIGLALAAAAVRGQPAQVPRKVMVGFESDAGLARVDAVYLRETLLTRLQREALVVLEPVRVVVSLADEACRELAVERGAEAWVRVAVSRAGRRLNLSLAWADLTGGQGAVEQRNFSRPELADLEGAFWDEVAQALAAAFPPVAQKLDPASAIRGEVALTALPGTIVRGLGEEPLEIGPEGVGRVALTRPGFYRIEATRKGSLPVREERYLAAADTEWPIVQRPAPRWMFEGYALNASYLGASAGRVFGPLYCRAGLTTYLIAPWLRDEDEEGRKASFGLTDLVAALGWLPFGPQARVGPYLEAAALVRIMHADGWLSVEPVAPIGCRAAVGVELAGGTRARLFADYGPVLYYVHGTDPSAVEASLMAAGDRQSGYLYKPWWGGVFEGVMIDMVGFRLGLRWYR